VLLALAVSIRADNYTFSFTGPGASGTSTFQIDPSQCGSDGCLVLDLSGEVNGTDLVADPAPASILQSDGPSNLFSGYSVFQFALDGTQTWIEWDQFPTSSLEGILFYGNGWDSIGDVMIESRFGSAEQAEQPERLRYNSAKTQN
jgi:hypothetical protein